MQPPLTDCAKQVLDQAQAEARGLNQEFVGTEHLALALAASEDCLAARGLSRLGINAKEVRSRLLSLMPHGQNPPVVTGLLPLSPKAQRTVNSAIVMAQSLREAKVSTRVLMLVLLEEQAAALQTALGDTGVDVDALKRGLMEKPVEAEQ